MSVAQGGAANLDAVLDALTTAEIADLKANWPLHPDEPDTTTDRYRAWLVQAYNMRHLFDDIATDPFV